MGLRAIADADPDGVCQRLLDECDFETTTEAELEEMVREQLALLEVGDPGCAWIGLRAALRVPSGWIRYRTHEGDLYYLRDGTEDSQREPGRSEIPNFKGSDLGRFPLVSADFWTSDRLSERSRSVDAFSGTRARGTLTLKRR